ncbi:glycerol-3-phosphate dehydrogenase [Aquabacterium sp. UBA2148]|uniref:glycerol-3-phosphate dehydrogenase n=1 Tax=Aquabacterium sp. UBA2148 TaxID=1946042 RepID=UPI00257DDD1A|nr:glycerol-3-phosphate dehydrogenase [Aquabacterium sp. UBA2148]
MNAPVPFHPPAEHDVLVVGGGINGVGIARDLAGRGLSVCLVEQDDLASHTSSASTKLIHGGLRYLEHREFGLVRKALGEREVLLRSAPHIMWPLRFVLPHDPGMRPAWLIRLGLFFYDHLARREVLPGSGGIDLRRSQLGVPLHPHFKRGFVYSDGWVDDARLVVLNAIDARERGATVLTRTRCVRAERGATHWQATLQGADGVRHVRARALINAAGPWAERFLRDVAHAPGGERLASRSLRLVKGSHIVVLRQFEHDHAYIFQNPDGRIIFAIPYERDFTLIGTTDQEVHDPLDARCEADEVAYLCEQASRYLAQAIRPSDVVWTYSGVRPLLDDASGDPSAVTRDYLLEQDERAAPLLTVWGGKITTYRQLAEDAATTVCRQLGVNRPAWTRGASLPGGDLSAWTPVTGRPDEDFSRFVLALCGRHPWLPANLAHRLARAHGSRIELLLGAARCMADLGAEVVPGVHEAELRHLMRSEWVTCADDVLWRRSKLGLHLTPSQREAVAHWFANQRPLALGGAVSSALFPASNAAAPHTIHEDLPA